MQKEKLQIVSIFRFGHKKRGLFQCPPKGKEHHTSPILTFPKGKERHTTASNTAKWNSRPLGRAWGGAYASSSNVEVIVGRRPASSSNSDGVAIPQPRVAGEARYPG